MTGDMMNLQALLGRSAGCDLLRERDRETRAGTVGLRIPTLWKGSYFPGFLEPRRLAVKALSAVVQEACIEGISIAIGR